jgi:hypothetical protein
LILAISISAYIIKVSITRDATLAETNNSISFHTSLKRWISDLNTKHLFTIKANTTAKVHARILLVM